MIDYTKIDKLLEVLYKNNGLRNVYIGEQYGYLFPEDDELNPLEYRDYIVELKNLDLAEPTGDATRMTITEFGKKVHKNGGWEKFLLEEAKQQIKDNKIQKWNIRDAMGSYFGLFVNAIAVLITIIFGINSCQKDDKVKILELKNDSLNAELNTKAKLLEQLQHKSETPKQTNDTLKRTTNQEL